VQFEWHDAKAEANLRTHGVSFERAKTVFKDTRAIEWLDDRENYGEQRFVILGVAEGGMLLYVAYAERGESIRIISARKVNQYEADEYLSQDDG
jgi:uncharacterized DUF497 family protein